MKATQPYYRIELKNLTESQKDWATGVVFASGAAGTEESLSFVQEDRRYEPRTLNPERANLSVYFLSEPDATLVHQLREELGQDAVIVNEEQSKDWLTEWKKGFQPFLLTDDVWVVPSWCEIPSAAKKFLRLDPGMAFGTGTHETTRLAAGFLQTLLCKKVEAANRRMVESFSSQGVVCAELSLLDVGTGTGVLALLAELYGVTCAHATDNDPEACRVARDNIALNQSRVVQVVEDISTLDCDGYDVVVANIIDGVLVELHEDLCRWTKLGGYLILTGILQERDERFRQEFSFQPFELLERRQLGEWVGYALRKRG